MLLEQPKLAGPVAPLQNLLDLVDDKNYSIVAVVVGEIAAALAGDWDDSKVVVAVTEAHESSRCARHLRVEAVKERNDFDSEWEKDQFVRNAFAAVPPAVKDGGACLDCHCYYSFLVALADWVACKHVVFETFWSLACSSNSTPQALQVPEAARYSLIQPKGLPTESSISLRGQEISEISEKLE